MEVCVKIMKALLDINRLNTAKMLQYMPICVYEI